MHRIVRRTSPLQLMGVKDAAAPESFLERRLLPDVVRASRLSWPLPESDSNMTRVNSVSWEVTSPPVGLVARPDHISLPVATSTMAVSAA
jgi:hypothetical protein